MNMLKNAAPALATAVGGPLGGMAMNAIASIFEYETRGAYVELLGQWGMLVMSFYFGGRTMEKLADKVAKK